MRFLAFLIATGGGIGFLPKLIKQSGAGTLGRILGTVILWLIITQTSQPITYAWLAIVISFFIGWPAVYYGEIFLFQNFGARTRHTGQIVDHDFNETIIDEIHGGLIAGLPIVYFLAQPIILPLVTSFFIFTIIDIYKPWPVNWFEEKFDNTALGVMIDDTVGSTITALCIWTMYLTDVLP